MAFRRTLLRTAQKLCSVSTHRLSTGRARLSAASLAASNGSSTIPYLQIDEKTRVIYQGFTGRNATENAQETIAYGTNVVGGVSPAKGGTEHLGLSVFSTVKEVCHAKSLPHATLAYVPATLAGAAIEEAISAEVPLVVSVAEHIPVHDMLRVQQILRTQSASRLVGPNSPGIIAPRKCRLGIMPYKQYVPGCVGIVSKSGTLSYEAVGATSAQGLGQSIVIGMGGDTMPGTNMVDALEIFYEHPETEGIIVIGEIGGTAELDAADSIRRYRERVTNPKPIIAMVAGRTAPKGKVMGHAEALLSPGEQSAEAKAQALMAAGAVVVPHSGFLGTEMKRLLGER